MTEPLFFSRLTLRREAAAIAPLLEDLAPSDSGRAMTVGHRLMWAATPDAFRAAHDPESGVAPFLWRDLGHGQGYFLLGPRPRDDQPYFMVETKAWEPALGAGDRLRFALRVNATVDRKVGVDAQGRARRRRSDVVMDLLHAQERGQPDEARGQRRMASARLAALAWLTAQGERNGFGLDAGRLVVHGYRVERLPRRGSAAKLGVLDLEGVLTVDDPSAFLDRVAAGFGRAKAFGCGLMLLRRAR